MINCSLCVLVALLLDTLTNYTYLQDTSKGFAGGVLDCPPSLSTASNPELSLSAYTDQSSYRIGDALKVTVQASQDAYISLLDHGSDPAQPHRAHVLYSNIWVKQGDSYVFPTDKRDQLKIAKPVGYNTLEVIASLKPLPQAEAGSKNVNLERNAEPTEAAEKIASSNCRLGFGIKPKN